MWDKLETGVPISKSKYHQIALLCLKTYQYWFILMFNPLVSLVLFPHFQDLEGRPITNESIFSCMISDNVSSLAQHEFLSATL